MQIWSPEKKERVIWSHFLSLTDFLGTTVLLNRRGQGNELHTGTLRAHTLSMFPSSGVPPAPRQDQPQLSIYCSWGSTPERHHGHTWTSFAPFHLNSHSTQPRGHWPCKLPPCHQVSQTLGFMLHKCHSDGLVCSSHTISNPINWRKKKYISITSGATIYSVDINQYTLYLSLGSGISFWPSCT